MDRGSSYIAVVCDRVHRSGHVDRPQPDYPRAWREGLRSPASRPPTPVISPSVRGGYLERLPLALVSVGQVERAEIWDFGHGIADHVLPYAEDGPHLTRRTFRLDVDAPPFASCDMLGFIATFGPPRILCVWGLGVDEAILRACASSIKIYNSIDAPGLRIPPEVSRHFNLILTGAEWQSEEVRRRHTEMRTEVMPIGPEFADPETFRPLGVAKDYDIIYVAAAQAYKRHDILFDALERLPRHTRALCVIGYGELRGAFEARTRIAGLDVDFVGPPGVGFDEVNALMNRAAIGVVCGVDDGAPAILTEYMLAGLPVLANAELRCGRQYITPGTGATAAADDFHLGLVELLARAPSMRPREIALSHWTWPHSARRLSAIIDELKQGPDHRLR
jgi:glycosyltransferase involved in cell wall biosynthesis